VKAEILKILEMAKNGMISDDEAAELIAVIGEKKFTSNQQKTTENRDHLEHTLKMG